MSSTVIEYVNEMPKQAGNGRFLFVSEARIAQKVLYGID